MEYRQDVCKMASEDVLISLAHFKIDHLLREVLNFCSFFHFDFKKLSANRCFERCVFVCKRISSNGHCPPRLRFLRFDGHRI
ncbi:hypothetical protein CEXT_524941 [Caerostris extrusa]|uniref:Uncharacterized protein n=1 Tax=Caerostris extrusa TaxID=172846 RepID=A0AAV4XF97_CAEEX|nr:hypothetical protein CEXT_524941 [Caerostris extrusa]